MVFFYKKNIFINKIRNYEESNKINRIRFG